MKYRQQSKINFGLPIMGGLFFFLPISTGATNIFIGLIIIYAVCLNLINRREIVDWAYLTTLPFLAFLIFFITLSLLAIFSSISWHESFVSLKSYLEILLMPFLAFVVIRYKKLRDQCFNGLMTSLFIILTISYLRYFDLYLLNLAQIKSYLPKMGGLDNPTVFKWHITHNFFMAFAALFWSYRTVNIANKKSILFYFYLFLTIAALFNILFMIKGRTGYIVVVVGILYFFIHRFGYRGIIFGLLVMGSLGGFLYLFSPNFYQRITLGFLEMYSWNPNEANRTSMGLRLEFIYHSIQIVSNNLLFGFGPGSFGQVYGEYATNLGLTKSANPHNQYILFLVETGLLGLITFLVLNYVCWQSSAKLSDFWKHATRIVLLSYGVANLFNSFLFDFSESLFFSAFMALAFSELIKVSKNHMCS